MTENEEPVVAREVKRQSVALAFSAIGTVITVYLFYKLSQPDVWREMKMRTALRAKRIASSQVDWWQKVADKAATIYNQERL